MLSMKSKLGRICEVCSNIVDTSSVLWSLQIAVHCENYTSFKWCFLMTFPILKYYLVLKIPFRYLPLLILRCNMF